MSHNPDCPCCGTASIGRRPKDPELDKLWTKLEKKLLAIGGDRVVWQDDVRGVPEILARGEHVTLPVTFLGLAPNLCHYHAAMLWAGDPERVTVMTGFGLYWDGVWRQHSWAIRGGVLLETNVNQEKYFGYARTNAEALDLFYGEYICQDFSDLEAGIRSCYATYPKAATLLRRALRDARHKGQQKKTTRAAVHEAHAAPVGL